MLTHNFVGGNSYACLYVYEALLNFMPNGILNTVLNACKHLTKNFGCVPSQHRRHRRIYSHRHETTRKYCFDNLFKLHVK